MAHCRFELCAGDLHVAHGLALDLFAVDIKRHGHRAEVFRLRQGIQRAGLAQIGQLVAHFIAVIRVERARRFEKALVARQIYQFLRDLKRQADRRCEFADHGDVLAEHRLDHDVAHHHHGQLHLLDGARRRRGHDGAGLHIHEGFFHGDTGVPQGVAVEYGEIRPRSRHRALNMRQAQCQGRGPWGTSWLRAS